MCSADVITNYCIIGNWYAWLTECLKHMLRNPLNNNTSGLNPLIVLLTISQRCVSCITLDGDVNWATSILTICKFLYLSYSSQGITWFSVLKFTRHHVIFCVEVHKASRDFLCWSSQGITWSSVLKFTRHHVVFCAEVQMLQFSEI